MVRPTKLIHPQRQAAKTRAAATILLLRDAADGYEVLMTRRSLQASFAPGAFVFPGGTVDSADGSALAHKLSRSRRTQTPEHRQFAVAAIREAFEELGILLATDGVSGAAASQGSIDGMDRAHGSDFLAQVAERGLTLSVDEVWWLAHWITDRDLPKRFDARFLVARMPAGQEPAADDTEQFEPVWISPKEALRRHEAGKFDMIFPTIRTLRRMAQWPSIDALFEACSDEGPSWISCPRAGYVNGVVERFCEDETAYGELELTSPDGQVAHHLDWQSEKPVRLLTGLWRLTAGNPGRMTGPGTNTYILGDSDAGFLVIDPGPPLQEHIDRIAALVGKQLKLILCTHSHPDHSPGAPMLQALTGAPILGRPSADTAEAHSFFRPDRTLVDGQVLDVGDMTLRVIHTPGHAANHLCFYIPEDRLLVSGDHVLNGSTTIVNPPDGNMRDYLHSLDRLAALEPLFILPAHGHVLGSAQEAIARLKRHRLMREAKVLHAVLGRPGGDLDDLVALAYDDTPVQAHGIAKRSLLAHLEKLAYDGQVAAYGAGWRALPAT
jgi:glyoxylase-like metal-dependent hydrolase (beta-lactamase superfamily II)/8-oxo-dGTP pyrophosphatase MutT (NUDIX family)